MKVDFAKLIEIAKQANEDPKKAEELHKDPKAYLASHGLEIPEQLHVKFLQETKGGCVCVCYCE